MDMTQESCRKFVEVLASSAPAPGGGGAAALMGAIGAALGNMAASLTVGKRKYAAVEAELTELMARCGSLQTRLLDQVEADERGFAPLARAYRIPREDPGRADALERAARAACAVPMEIMELCGQALECVAVIGEKCARIAVSDAGCAALCCKAALQAASLNVFVNTKDMKDREAAGELNRRANTLLEKYCPLADGIVSHVLSAVCTV